MSVMGGGRRCAAAALLAAAVGAVVAPAVQAQGPEAPLWARLERVEAAFKGGDAGGLRPSFAGNCKVRVDLKDLTEGPAWYGPGQLQVVFEHVFQDNDTREFAFRKQDVTVGPPGTAFAKGRWVRRARPGGPETVDTLTFTLREENHDWRIHEIVTSR
jgi:hypothetical protein